MDADYIGIIQMFACDFVPNGWFPCDGRLLAIEENETLFDTIGNTYGGDEKDGTFALPDLRGYLVVGVDNTTYKLGETGGSSKVSLDISQIPDHSHAGHMSGSDTPANSDNPAAAYLGDSLGTVLGSSDGLTLNIYAPAGSAVAMYPGSVVASTTGVGKAHTNLMPSLGLLYCINAFGYYIP